MSSDGITGAVEALGSGDPELLRFYSKAELAGRLEVFVRALLDEERRRRPTCEVCGDLH